MTEELKQKAENYIIDRYKINECYREDNEETREYMKMDVHSQYEEQYQLYLAGLHEGQSQLAEAKEIIKMLIGTVRELNNLNVQLTDVDGYLAEAEQFIKE